MATVLVLGSTGKLGALLRKHWPVDSPLNIIWHGRRGTVDVAFDILDEYCALEAAIDRSDAIFLLAGRTTDPLQDNVEIARTVIAAVQGKPLVFASSAAVYGSGICAENAKLEPYSDYGRIKCLVEGMIGAYHGKHCILRIGNVIGADALLGAERSNYRLHVFADGTSLERSYINPSLLASVLQSVFIQIMGDEEMPDILNIACPEPVFMAELLDQAGLPWTAEAAPAGVIPSVVLETALLEEIFEFPPNSSSPKQLLQDWNT